MLARKEKIMGFGHAVYRYSDPRNTLIKDGGNNCPNARDPSEISSVPHRRMTSYLDVREAHSINIHFGIIFLLVPMMTARSRRISLPSTAPTAT